MIMDYTLNCNGRLVDLSTPQVMGILNATPDSFYAGSRKQTEAEIANRTVQILSEGGTIIDVGACSTRPDSTPVGEAEETERLRRALAVVRREAPEAVVSVDTYRPDVARMAVEEYGADIINDVSEGGLTGFMNPPLMQEADAVPQMFKTVARLRVPYILMSVQPTLRQMLLSFAREVDMLHSLGQKDIILDPGFGFGKTLEQNYAIYAELERLQMLRLPLLVGISRKSMLYRLLGTDPTQALNGTTVLNTVALTKGASILRVHDVREAVECVRVMAAMAGGAAAESQHTGQQGNCK